MRSIIVAAGAVLLSGCATGLTSRAFDPVRKDVAARIGYDLQWRGVTAVDSAVDDSIHALLAHPLSADAAVQIALLNNRSLQATYEDIGIAEADLVQAGLLKNPVFSIGVRFPDRSPGRTYLDFSVEEDFVDVFLLPMRKKLAEISFEQAKARVTDAVVEKACETRQAFFNYQAAEQERELRSTVLNAQAASFDAAERLHQAGNVNDVSLLNESASHSEAQLALATAEAKVDDARERLNDLMGVWGNDTLWTAPGRLAELPVMEIDRHGLESLAIRDRADLVAARQDLLEQAQSLGFANDLRFLASLEVGPEGERETDGQWRFGPVLSVPVPLFDQGQATVAKATAQFRQSQQRFFALAVSIRSQVRAAREQMFNARLRVEFIHHDLLPVHEKLVQQTQLLYNAMQVGVFQLLQARQNQIEAGADYIAALHDYWSARTDLQRAVGGKLPEQNPTTQRGEHETNP